MASAYLPPGKNGACCIRSVVHHVAPDGADAGHKAVAPEPILFHRGCLLCGFMCADVCDDYRAAGRF